MKFDFKLRENTYYLHTTYKGRRIRKSTDCKSPKVLERWSDRTRSESAARRKAGQAVPEVEGGRD